MGTLQARRPQRSHFRERPHLFRIRTLRSNSVDHVARQTAVRAPAAPGSWRDCPQPIADASHTSITDFCILAESSPRSTPTTLSETDTSRFTDKYRRMCITVNAQTWIRQPW